MRSAFAAAAVIGRGPLRFKRVIFDTTFFDDRGTRPAVCRVRMRWSLIRLLACRDHDGVCGIPCAADNQVGRRLGRLSVGARSIALVSFLSKALVCLYAFCGNRRVVASHHRMMRHPGDSACSKLHTPTTTTSC
jgi:hypothetical protein